MASNNSTAKTHVSLRLPTYLLESIDAHAERESISRTEAFVHYLQTGLEISDDKANEPSADEALLQSIQSELAEIKAMLKAGGASVPTAAVAEEDDTMVPVSFTSEEEDDEVETEDEFTTSDAVYESTVEVEDEISDEGQGFFEGAEDETAAMFDASDAVASPDEMPVEEVAPAAPVSNVFSPNYQPATAVETIEDEDVEADEPMETLSDYYDEVAAEQEAEDDFTGSDAVEEGDIEEDVDEAVEEDEIEDNPYVSSSYFSGTTEENEDEAEEGAEEFSGSDAVFEDASDGEDEDDNFVDDGEDDFEEEVDEFDASDEVIDVEEVEDDYSNDTEDDFEDDFTDSDEVFATEETDSSYSHEEAANLDLSVGSAVIADYSDDEEEELDIDEVVYVEPLALADLEDAVNLVAQQFPMIEKVWLFGNAATGGAIEQDTIDLCVKADKFKSKYADLFISMLEDNTGKSVNVVLRNDMEKSVKQIWKATRIDLYRA